MPEYPNGTPSWVDLSAQNGDATADFYTQLFGWTIGEASEEGGGYRMFLQGEAPVAGLMPAMGPEQPHAWLTYVAVDDADATVATAKAAGAQVFAEPMDVMDIGRMAVLADPAGAVFGLWQGRAFVGAGLVNEPVSFVWSDIATRDRAAAVEFYGELFGWSAAAADFDPSGHYTVFSRPDGRQIGGTLEMTDGVFPAGTPAHWGVSFAVADTDTIVERVGELGGQVTAAAMDCPIGRFASFLDPFGASFSVMALAAAPTVG